MMYLHLSVHLSFYPVWAISPEQKLIETSNLVEVFLLVCATDSPIFRQKGQMSKSHGLVEFLNSQCIITDWKSAVVNAG